MPTADQIIKLLDLQPLPIEGGMFRLTYISSERYSDPSRSPQIKALSTAIYYLLTAGPDSFSALHRLPTDEVWHFYLGDTVEMMLLAPDGRDEIVHLGPDLLAGQRVQYVVPAGVWQGARLAAGGDFALMGTTMAPGFIESDYEGGERAALVAAYPDQAERIHDLTRS